MQPNISPAHIIRSSYGFPMQEQFGLRSPQNKGFPQQQPPFFPTHHNHQDNLAASIKSLEARIENVESPGRKKVSTGQSSPTLFCSTETKYKPQYPTTNELKVQEPLNDQFLRGSCSNVLRKFEQSNNNNNLTTSLRNTTHFNPITKFPSSPNEPRKLQEEANPFKSSTASKGGTESTSSSGTYLQKPVEKTRPNEAMSRTPSKLFAEKKLDESVKLTNKTPIKYKNVFEGNKNSGISKGNNQTEEKKTFKSLNEIIQCKAKEKLQKNQPAKKHSKMINGFELGANLGKGKFGQVFLGRHHDAGFVAAIKKIVKSKVVEYKMVDQLCTEIRLHSCLDHPNIVKFYGFFQEKDDIYLVIQYMNGGTLFDYLNEVTSLPLRETIQYLRDIIQAIIYMHEKSIAHRDIKPQNIVISSEGVAKLCDFGWSALVETSRKTYCGTFDYAPPEILERKAYDTSVDIWCIGVLTYELLTGRVPFQGDQRNVVMEKIVNVDKKKIEYPATVPPQAREFIEALMQKDPNLRPKCQDLLKFKLFTLYPRIGSKPAPSTTTPKKPA